MKCYYTYFLIFLLLLSCSTSNVLKRPFEIGSSLDHIPDSFEPTIMQKDSPFEDITEKIGLSNIKAYNFNIIDLNGDNYSDLVVIPSFYSQPLFFIFDIHKKKFIKAASPFLKNFKVSFMLFYDINNDRVIDAITGVLNQETELSAEPLRIFYGKRTKGSQKLSFKEKKTSLKPTANTSVNLIDFNLDGKLDLFIGNWFRRQNRLPIPSTDKLLKNVNGIFVDKTELLQDEERKNPDQTMHINAFPTYGAQICDIDQNGFPDIITTSTNKYQNKLWMNKYKFRERYRFFENYGVTSGVAGDVEGLLNSRGGGRTFGVSCADYNNDGIMDLFLGELSHNYDHEGIDKSSLLTGRSLKFPPKFYRTEYFLDNLDPNWHQADRRGVWVDLNNDGLLDLIVDNSGYPPHTRLIVFEQQPDHSFTNKSKEYGVDIINPIGTVIADFNRDGKMDILTAQSQIRDEKITPRIFVFQNNLDLGKRKSVRFYLRGEKANYHGLNAMIILKIKTVKGIVYRRQNVSYSYGSLPPQNEEGVLFGLDEGEELDSVTVRWPYSKSINQSRAGLERTYKIKNKFTKTLNITLCEGGQHLIGRRNCF